MSGQARSIAELCLPSRQRLQRLEYFNRHKLCSTLIGKRTQLAVTVGMILMTDDAAVRSLATQPFFSNTKCIEPAERASG